MGVSGATLFFNMTRPFFSICIPNFNYGRFLGMCLDSVLNQTCRDFEVIVCDNCSTDDSRKILNSFKDKRLKVIFQEKTVPAAANFNRALFAASGVYIKALPSDDLLFPWYLETVREAVRLYPEVQTLITPSVPFKDDGEIQKLISCREEGKWVLCDINDALRLNRELKINMVMPTNNMFRAESFREAGGYPEETIYGSQWSFDFVLFCKLLVVGPIALYTAPLCAERIHHKQGRRRKDSSQVLYDHFWGINYLLASKRINSIEAMHLERLLSTMVGQFFCYGIKNLTLGNFKVAFHTAKVFCALGLFQRPVYVIESSTKYLRDRFFKRKI